MADERKYYVLCGSNCKFESMTKEQILTAIEQATSTGEIKDVNSGFITTIKEQNAQSGLKFWVGTSAQYNAIAEKQDNVLYILTDEATEEDINAAFLNLNNEIENLQKQLDKKVTLLFSGNWKRSSNWNKLSNVENVGAYSILGLTVSDGYIQNESEVIFACRNNDTYTIQKKISNENGEFKVSGKITVVDDTTLANDLFYTKTISYDEETGTGTVTGDYATVHKIIGLI